jgi:predicted RNase H-like HicB family nuclease
MKKQIETIYNFDVVFEDNGDGYTVTVPKLPGLVTEGYNLKQAREMAKDAIKCYLEALLKDIVIAGKSKKEKIKFCFE